MTGPKKLAGYLSDSGLTQQQFSKKTGILPDMVSRYLSGQRVPQVRAALAIERATYGDVPVSAWVSRRRARAEAVKP